MRNLKTTLLASSLFFISIMSLKAQWQAVEYPIEKGNITHVDLTDPFTVYVVFRANNEFTIEKSTDAGDSWAPIPAPVDLMPFEFQAIHFYEKQKGVVVVRNLTNDIQPTKIYHTKDDGLSWTDITPVETATGIGNAAVQFLNEDIGFLSTDTFLYKTIDGGQSWTTHELPGYIMNLDFIDESNGSVGLFDGTFFYNGGMFCTNDGGENWEGKYLDIEQTVVGNVKQVTADKAYAIPSLWGSANENSVLYFTEDAGVNWDSIAIPQITIPMGLFHLHVDDEEQIHIVTGDGAMVYVYNMDEDHSEWILEESFDDIFFYNADFSADAAFLSGNEGLFYIKNLINAAGEPALNQVELYPNPTKPGDILLIRGLQGNYHLQLFDLNGRLVLSPKELIGESFDIPELPSGIYMLHLTDGSSEIVKRIIVE